MTNEEIKSLNGMITDYHGLNIESFILKLASSPLLLVSTISGAALWLFTVITYLTTFSFGGLFEDIIPLLLFSTLVPSILTFLIMIIGQIIFTIGGVTHKTTTLISGISVLGIGLKAKVIIQSIFTFITTILFMKLVSVLNIGAYSWLLILIWLIVVISFIVAYSSAKKRLDIYRYMIESKMLVSDMMPMFPGIMCFIMALVLIIGIVLAALIHNAMLIILFLIEIVYYVSTGIVMIYNKTLLMNEKTKIMQQINK